VDLRAAHAEVAQEITEGWARVLAARDIRVIERAVKRGEVLSLEMAASGGCAIELRP